jgi:hypothetical protein
MVREFTDNSLEMVHVESSSMRFEVNSNAMFNIDLLLNWVYSQFTFEAEIELVDWVI